MLLVLWVVRPEGALERQDPAVGPRRAGLVRPWGERGGLPGLGARPWPLAVSAPGS